MIKPYFFTKGFPCDFQKSFSEIQEAGGIVCFDFEDSIDFSDSSSETGRKIDHRKKIISWLQSTGLDFFTQKIGFRINSINAILYKSDIEALKSFPYPASIFIPKTEDKALLEKVLADIGFPANEVIPVIETVRGMDNLFDILSVSDSRVQNIAFGHCDYNLSLGIFPFAHHDSSMYWEWVKTLCVCCHKMGKGLIHSPVLALNDFAFFNSCLFEANLLQASVGQIVLCRNQAEWCIHFDKHQKNGRSLNQKENLDVCLFAEKLIFDFEKFLLSQRAFAVTPDRILISPQEYRAALQYLNEI